MELELVRVMLKSEMNYEAKPVENCLAKIEEKFANTSSLVESQVKFSVSPKSAGKLTA